MGEPAFIFLEEWMVSQSFSLGKTLLVLGGWILLWLIPLLLLSYITYFLVTIPLRRKERAWLFLDILQTGFARGQRPENIIPEISKTRETSVGARFHLLAAHLEKGMRLGEALEKVPRFLPPQISAMLKVGEEFGDMAKVLPACRTVLSDAYSQTRAGFNYLILMAFVFAPITPLIYLMLRVYVFPKFRELFHGLGLQSPAIDLIFDVGQVLAWAQFSLCLLLYLLAALYIGGPRVSSWFRGMFGGLIDHLQFSLPWRRKRMQRDFIRVLGILLDSGVPEAKAVQLAGTSAANSVLQAKSRDILFDLKNGVRLEDALTRLSKSSELRWRLKNAFHGGSFLQSLSGWLEYLDAKAFQQEQAAAHVVSTGFVVINGALIGLIVAGIFQVLILLLNDALLW